ncbi:unnamed protein product [Amoebophrya sp. A25]|nr:unnamed protein product [Amoebophrya sp. A25]|eukprot:GSA25T00007161001.1
MTTSTPTSTRTSHRLLHSLPRNRSFSFSLSLSFLFLSSLTPAHGLRLKSCISCRPHGPEGDYVATDPNGQTFPQQPQNGLPHIPSVVMYDITWLEQAVARGGYIPSANELPYMPSVQESMSMSTWSDRMNTLQAARHRLILPDHSVGPRGGGGAGSSNTVFWTPLGGPGSSDSTSEYAAYTTTGENLIPARTPILVFDRRNGHALKWAEFVQAFDFYASSNFDHVDFFAGVTFLQDDSHEIHGSPFSTRLHYRHCPVEPQSVFVQLRRTFATGSQPGGVCNFLFADPLFFGSGSSGENVHGGGSCARTTNVEVLSISRAPRVMSGGFMNFKKRVLDKMLGPLASPSWEPEVAAEGFSQQDDVTVWVRATSFSWHQQILRTNLYHLADTWNKVVPILGAHHAGMEVRSVPWGYRGEEEDQTDAEIRTRGIDTNAPEQKMTSSNVNDIENGTPETVGRRGWAERRDFYKSARNLHRQFALHTPHLPLAPLFVLDNRSGNLVTPPDPLVALSSGAQSTGSQRRHRRDFHDHGVISAPRVDRGRGMRNHVAEGVGGSSVATIIDFAYHIYDEYDFGIGISIEEPKIAMVGYAGGFHKSVFSGYAFVSKKELAWAIRKIDGEEKSYHLTDRNCIDFVRKMGQVFTVEGWRRPLPMKYYALPTIASALYKGATGNHDGTPRKKPSRSCC